jgi:ketosteroid isomerase-like protein
MNETRAVVEQFWARMNANDFAGAGQLLADDCVCLYPQSGERFIDRASWVAMNAEYPVNGSWRFTVERLVVDGDQAVTDVVFTDADTASVTRTIGFFEVRGGLIVRLTEYWPDPFDPPASRSHLVRLH